MPNLWFAAIFLIGGSVSLTLAFIVARRSAPGAVPFAVMMLSVAWWEWSRAAESVSTGAVAKLFWSQVQYLGVAVVPVAWFLFALQYRGASKLGLRRVLVLAILPVLLIFAVFTNQFHGLYWASVTNRAGGTPENLDLLVYGQGPLFWVFLVFNYLLILAGVGLIVQAVLTTRELYRQQAAAIFVGTLLPWLANAAYVFGVIPLRGVDVLALTVSGLVWFFVLYRYRFLDLVPVAYDLLVHSMRDGVIVLDVQDRIVEINAAARRLLAQRETALIGETAKKVLAVIPQAWEKMPRADEADVEIELPPPQSRYLHLRVSPLRARHGVVNGRLLLLQDITTRKRAEQELQEMNERLQGQLLEIQALQAILKEQAMRDPLTGLYNRRFLYEMLANLLRQAEHAGEPVCVIMIDIDHFKSFNDRFGHSAGDAMLKALSERLGAHLRQGDFLCRYGGEEFVAILPGVALDAGTREANEWCKAVRGLCVPHAGALLGTTLSMGVAAFPRNGDTLDAVLGAADQALYAAKAAGRNGVRSAAILEAAVPEVQSKPA